MVKRTVAAFDFDKTITHRDSFLQFLFYALGPFKAVWVLFLSLYELIPLLVGNAHRQRAKEAVLTRGFKGRALEEVLEMGKRFAKEKLPGELNPEAVKRIQWHKDRGDELVLISASIDVYLSFFGKEMGFDEVLTSQVEVNGDGRLTGKLKGKNCRNSEKVRRLEEAVGPKKEYLLYAYGDSDGDKELLALADHSYYRYIPKSGGEN